jgi:hypothetical protein
MLGLQANLFHQFPVHGLLRRLSRLDPALRELPGVLSDSLAPKHLVARIDQYDPNVWAISIAIEHDHHPGKIDLSPIFS